MFFENSISSFSSVVSRSPSFRTSKSESIVNSNGNLSWTYTDNERKYHVFSKNNKVVLKSEIEGKNKEIILVAEEAKKIQNILSKMDLSVSAIAPIKPIKPIKPMQPMKPMGPFVSSFDSPEEQKKILNEYSKEVESYISECKKNLSDYQFELSKYESKLSLNGSKEPGHEINSKKLIDLLDRLFIASAKTTSS